MDDITRAELHDAARAELADELSGYGEPGRTLAELAQNVRITCEYGAIRQDFDKLDDWQKQAHPYRCTIRYQGRRYSFDYFMGQGHTSEPTVSDALDALLSEAAAGADSFTEFCNSLGYDEDSRKAYRMWQACQRTERNMRRLLGDDYETFLYAERD